MEPDPKWLEYVKLDLRELDGIASAMDVGPEYTARQRRMKQLLDNIRMLLMQILGGMIAMSDMLAVLQEALQMELGRDFEVRPDYAYDDMLFRRHISSLTIIPSAYIRSHRVWLDGGQVRVAKFGWRSDMGRCSVLVDLSDPMAVRKIVGIIRS